MRQLRLRRLTLGKKSTSHGVSSTRKRRSRLSVECLERRDLLASGMLTGVAYEIDAVTGTDYYGLPYITSVESTGNLTTASGSLPIQYNEQFPPGYATMNGTINFTFPQTVTTGQTASISASARPPGTTPAWVSAGPPRSPSATGLDLAAWMTRAHLPTAPPVPRSTGAIRWLSRRIPIR